MGERSWPFAGKRPLPPVSLMEMAWCLLNVGVCREEPSRQPDEHESLERQCWAIYECSYRRNL